MRSPTPFTRFAPLTPLKLLLARAVLALLLLVGQNQATLHWLSHAIDATQAKYGGPLPSDHCDDCVSFAAFGAAAPSGHALPPPPAAALPPMPEATATIAPSALQLAFRSRAPPVLL